MAVKVVESRPKFVLTDEKRRRSADDLVTGNLHDRDHYIVAVDVTAAYPNLSSNVIAVYEVLPVSEAEKHVGETLYCIDQNDLRDRLENLYPCSNPEYSKIMDMSGWRDGKYRTMFWVTAISIASDIDTAVACAVAQGQAIMRGYVRRDEWPIYYRNHFIFPLDGVYTTNQGHWILFTRDKDEVAKLLKSKKKHAQYLHNRVLGKKTHYAGMLSRVAAFFTGWGLPGEPNAKYTSTDRRIKIAIKVIRLYEKIRKHLVFQLSDANINWITGGGDETCNEVKLCKHYVAESKKRGEPYPDPDQLEIAKWILKICRRRKAMRKVGDC